MNRNNLVRLAIILLVVAGLSFFTGGIARTAHLGGGPWWLGGTADVLWGVFVCCLAGAGICAVSSRLSKGDRKGWNKLSDALKLMLGIAGVILGLTIILTRMASLLSSIR